MAAVTGSMEEGEVLEGVSTDGLAGLEGVRSAPRELASMHRGLTSTHWLRSALGWYLQKVKLRHEWKKDELVLRVVEAPMSDGDGPYIPRNAVGWSQMPGPLREAKVWSFENSKMNCPSFDLPTGAGTVGGTCPGAQEGQSINPGRRGVLPNGQPVNLQTAICMSCYGEGGPIAYTNNQVRQMMRHIWAVGMVQQAPDQLIEVLTESILAMPDRLFSPDRIKPAPGDILPIRLHTVGDFFSPAYAAVWIEVCNRVASSGSRGRRFRFWAPTRTWAAPGWDKHWPQLVRGLKQPNLVVRPSAFHFDDPAPPPLAPRLGAGSTSMHVHDKKTELQRDNFNAQGEEKKFFDWMCPTYSAREGQLKSCAQSPNPDGRGTTHCRACWIRPDLRINYPAH